MEMLAEKRAKADKARKELEKNLFQKFRLLRSPEGEKVMEGLAELCHPDKLSYSPGINDKDWAFLEGQRSVFIRIKRILEEGDKSNG